MVAQTGEEKEAMVSNIELSPVSDTLPAELIYLPQQ